ncbi:MAG: YraN family protein [Desulfuromonas sp.]|nr:MAG: YraN family protein [Desulfuromonas sp.]
MTEQRLAFGQWGEDEAAAYLRTKGLTILLRNYRTPVGEIDIIARNRRFLVFVEVKTRRSRSFGTPQEAVGFRKQRQIIRTAQWFLANGAPRKLQPRFDVIGVMPAADNGAHIEHITDAFSLDFSG